MARLVDDVLEAWREAERLVAELSPVSPHHEAAERAVTTLRSAYQELTAQRRVPRARLEAMSRLAEKHVATVRSIREEIAG
jgi:hypothetical protein